MSIFNRFFLLSIGAIVCLSACTNLENPTSKPTSEVNNEGSIAAPITLTTETTRTCKVNTLKDNQAQSYYKFTVTTDGIYYINGSNFSPGSVDGFSPSVYSNPGYEPPAIFTSTGNYTTQLTCDSLTADTV